MGVVFLRYSLLVTWQWCTASSVSGLSRSSRMRLLAEGQWDVDRTADCR